MKTVLALSEAAFGRRTLWRVGRAAYAYARRDHGSDIATNGERDLQRAIASLNRPITVLDVGANLGQWALSLLELRREDLTLVCFEPSPETFRRLGQAVPQAVRVNAALSDHEGTAEFSLIGPTAGTNTLGKSVSGRTITVPVSTVSAYVAQHGLGEIDLLKIDAEGFDALIIRGALPLLRERRIGVVQFEYNSQWAMSRSFLSDVAEMIEGLPYSLGKVVPGGIEMFDEWRPELERFFEANYALVRDDMRATVNARIAKFDRSNTVA